MILNLVSASNASNREVLWGFMSRYAPGVTAQTHPKLDELAGYAIRYFNDFVKPSKTFHQPDDEERAALTDLLAIFEELPEDVDGATIQDAVLNVGRKYARYHDPKKTAPDGSPAVTGEWFNALYRTLIGQERGPRFGSFAALYGVKETAALIASALDGSLYKQNS